MSTTGRLVLVKRFAVAAHGDQKYGDLPYEVHLEQCVGVTRRLVTDAMLEEAQISREQLQTAVWLHDVIEDCSGRCEDGHTRRAWMKSLIEVVFGPVVAEMVSAVTDVEGENRKARKWGTPGNPGPMVKLRDRPDAVLVKLVDRIANVEASLASEEKLPEHRRHKSMAKKYRDEQVDLRTLRRAGAVEALWDHLEDLLKPAAGPEAFEGVSHVG